MPEDPNVVKPAASPTPPAINPPTPSGSPAAPAASKPEDVKPKVDSGAKPPEGMVPINALHEEREKRQAIDGQLNQLKALFGDKFTLDGAGNVVATQPAAQPQQQPMEDVKVQLDKAWEEDPRKAVNMEMMMALDWYDRTNASVDWQKDAARSKYSDFNTYDAEVSKYVKQLPLMERGKPGAIELAYLVVRGQKAPATLEAEKAKWLEDMQKRVAAGESVQGLGGGSMPQGTPSGASKPTQEQINVASAMGMSTEDYMKNTKASV